MPQPVLGIAGWSGAGKTTLIEAVMPGLRDAGLVISTIKHAHHGAELDKPGKDSWRHRQAGAREVMLATPGGWTLIHTQQSGEPALDELLAAMRPADLILVEGFRSSPIPKLEVFRPALGKPPLWPDWPEVLAVATDDPALVAAPPCLPLNDAGKIVAWIVAFAHGRLSKP